MKKEQHILIAIESFFDGGAEIFAIRLANELALTQKVFFAEIYPYRSKEKRQIALLDQSRIKLFQREKNFIADRLHKNGGPDRATGFRKKIYSFLQKRSERQMISFIKKNKITVVNSHSWDSDVYFAQLKKQVGFKLISSFHGHYEFLKGLRQGFAEDTKQALEQIDTVIYTSPRHQQTLDENGFPKERRKKIFYGVSMPLAQEPTVYQSGEKLKLVMAARGIADKGWEAANEAVLSLLEKYPNRITLTLAGEGGFLNEMKARYRNDALQFLGYRENVRAVVDEAHIGLLPTFYIAESLPNTVIEYLFSGKPVISTNVGAIPEMIAYNEKKAGVILELKNNSVDKGELAKAIENYLTDPSLVERDSVVALRAAEKFMMKTCINNYLEAFES